MKFKDNIYASVEQFFQTRTYYGLLEGTPDSRINAGMLKSDLAKAERFFGIKRIHVIPPVQKKQIMNSGKEIATLPSVTCMAELSHYNPMNDLSKECSRLCLIWYQDEFAFPVAPFILEQLKELDWAKLSEDAYL